MFPTTFTMLCAPEQLPVACRCRTTRSSSSKRSFVGRRSPRSCCGRIAGADRQRSTPTRCSRPSAPRGRTPDRMIVLDSSALIDALVYPLPNPDLRRRLDEATSIHVPHLLDLELLHVLRSLVRDGRIGSDRADDVRRDVLDLPFERYPHGGLSDRVWELR